MKQLQCKNNKVKAYIEQIKFDLKFEGFWTILYGNLFSFTLNMTKIGITLEKIINPV